jgi:hypothetical protein
VDVDDDGQKADDQCPEPWRKADNFFSSITVCAMLPAIDRVRLPDIDRFFGERTSYDSALG